MPAPYIIWTLRRTGGTTLATLLGDLSGHPEVQHEPFNLGRAFETVLADWKQGRDEARLRAGMAAALAARPVIKHCFEIMPPALNRALIEAARPLGYQHIVLDRRAEVDRILSLELAGMTGVWGPKTAPKVYGDIDAGKMNVAPLDIDAAVAHLRKCHKRRAEIRGLLDGCGPRVVFFEDLYHDLQEGRAQVRALAGWLGIDPNACPGFDQRLDKALVSGGQNSARIQSAVPNIDAARRALDAAQAEHFAGFARQKRQG